MAMHILIVGADERLAATFQAGLRMQGYTVDVTGLGTVGLNLANTARYDIVILDSDIADIDAISFCRRLHVDGRHVPLILLTPSDTPHEGIAGLDAGADTYLTKPVAFAELLARIRALRRRDNQATATMLRVADLTLDPKTREVRRGGHLIALTRTEYAIIEYLLRHPNQVLSHAQIAAAAWEDGPIVTSDALKVHIAALRRKLHDEQESRLLHTVRGKGYSLRPPAGSPEEDHRDTPVPLTNER
jgi:DNA-binding response OmpR family regulator